MYFPGNQLMNQPLCMKLIKRNMSPVEVAPMMSDIVEIEKHGGFVVYTDRLGERYYASQEALA